MVNLIHCFLNQWGYSIMDEANFHFNKSIERALIMYGVFQRLQKLEEKVNELKNKVE